MTAATYNAKVMTAPNEPIRPRRPTPSLSKLCPTFCAQERERETMVRKEGREEGWSKIWERKETASCSIA